MRRIPLAGEREDPTFQRSLSGPAPLASWLALAEHLELGALTAPLEPEDLRPIHANPTAARMLGIPVRWMEDAPELPVADQSTLEELRDRIQEDGKAGGSPLIRRILDRPGADAARVEARTIPVVSEGSADLLTVLQPHQSPMDPASQEAKARYEQLVLQAPVPIGIHQDGRIVLANAAAADLFDLDHPSQLVGEPVLDLVHPDDRPLIEERMRALAAGEDVSRVEERLLHPDGSTIHAEVSATRVVYEGAPATQVVLLDAGEQRAHERRQDARIEELERANEDLESFRDRLAHDLKAPLDTASRFLQRLSQQAAGDLDEERLEDLELAADAIARTRSRLEAVETYTRMSTSDAPLEPTDLDAVVADALQDLENRVESTQATVAVTPLPEVLGNRPQLCRLFENLICNALKYSGGDPPRIEISAETDGRWPRVHVEDEGAGMAPDRIDKAFEMFERLDADHEGHGCGLAICDRIVDAHGGSIEIDSAPDQGTRVTLTFEQPPAGRRRGARSAQGAGHQVSPS